jgi:hypothetical protein
MDRAMGMPTADHARRAGALEPAEGSCLVTILGAGRSGTSAITRGMGAIGIDLGTRLRRGRGKNPTGFFEDTDVLRLSKKLKRALGVGGHSVRLIEDHEWDLPHVRAIHPICVETLRRRFGGNPLWGYKYGRTLRFLPFWLRVWDELELDVRYVVALRNPLSVARSRARLEPERGTQEKSDLEWLVNIVPYFHLARVRPLVVIDYDQVMADPARELERMARGLGIPLENRSGIDEYRDSYLKTDMRHSGFTIEDLARDGRINRLTRDAYTWLYRLATDEIEIDDAALCSDWKRIEEGVAELRPILRHIDTVQNALLRAQRSFRGPLQAVPDLWRRARAIR